MDVNKIIREELNDFDWAEEIEAEVLSVGNFVYIDGSTNDGNSPDWGDGSGYIVLKITAIEDEEEDEYNWTVRYVTIDTNLDDERSSIDEVESTSYENARNLVDTEYWKLWDNENDTIVNESNDFGWTEEIEPDFTNFLRQYHSDNHEYKIWVGSINPENKSRMMNAIYNQGFEWRGDHGRFDTSGLNMDVIYLKTDEMTVSYDGGDHSMDSFLGRGVYERDAEDSYYVKAVVPTGEFFDMLGMSEVTNTITPLTESNDFDWAGDIDVTHKVGELEVGKTYQFVPDFTELEHEDVEDVPTWVYDYGTSKFFITNQEPESGHISFKPVGKASDRMFYARDDIRLPHGAQVFVWGKFKEIESPIMESNDFDWAEDAPIAHSLENGSTFYIVDNSVGGTASNKDRVRHLIQLGDRYSNSDGIEMVEMYEADKLGDLEFYHTGYLDISNITWELDDDGDIEVGRAIELINNRYWRPWSHRGEDF